MCAQATRGCSRPPLRLGPAHTPFLFFISAAAVGQSRAGESTPSSLFPGSFSHACHPLGPAQTSSLELSGAASSLSHSDPERPSARPSPQKLPTSEPGKMLRGLSRGETLGQVAAVPWNSPGALVAGQRTRPPPGLSPSPCHPAAWGTEYSRSSLDLPAGHLRVVTVSSSSSVISSGFVGCFTRIKH